MTIRTQRLLASMLFGGLCLATLALPAQATPITISNQSFEANGLGDGLFTSNSATSWTSVANTWGVFNSVNNNFTGTTGSPGTLPGTATGTHYAYLNSGSSAFGQILSDNLAPNTQYTLTVAIGNNKVEADGEVRFSLFANSVELAGLTVNATSLVTTDTFQDFSFIYTTGPSVTAFPLEIRFAKISGGQNAVDNVRLDGVAVPEPISLAMWLFGALGMILVARNRR